MNGGGEPGEVLKYLRGYQLPLIPPAAYVDGLLERICKMPLGVLLCNPLDPRKTQRQEIVLWRLKIEDVPDCEHDFERWAISKSALELKGAVYELNRLSRRMTVEVSE